MLEYVWNTPSISVECSLLQAGQCLAVCEGDTKRALRLCLTPQGRARPQAPSRAACSAWSTAWARCPRACTRTWNKGRGSSSWARTFTGYPWRKSKAVSAIFSFSKDYIEPCRYLTGIHSEGGSPELVWRALCTLRASEDSWVIRLIRIIRLIRYTWYLWVFYRCRDL